MKCTLACLLLSAVALSVAGGCSMCCGVYDYDYSTYGGLVPRHHPSYGRVGSVFSDPGATMGEMPESETEPLPPPRQRPTPDSLELDERQGPLTGPVWSPRSPVPAAIPNKLSQRPTRPLESVSPAKRLAASPPRGPVAPASGPPTPRQGASDRPAIYR